jgi:hypothetical protein
MKGEIHQNDVGTAFQSQIRDENDAVVNVSAATNIAFVFQKSNKNEITVAGQFITDGKDGWVQYITQPGDLDMTGNWQFQVIINMPPNYLFHSDIIKFKVYPNL